MTDGGAPTSQANKPLFDMTLVIGAILLLALALTWWLKSGVNGEPIGGLKPGSDAPQIVAGDWINGPAPTAEELQGKVVVLNGWFTTCPFCASEAPVLVEAYEKYRDQGVVFLGLTFEEAERLDQIKKFVDDNGITWPNGYDARPTLVEFEAEYFPAVWVIGRDGKVVWNRDSEGEMTDGIELALSQEFQSQKPGF